MEDCSQYLGSCWGSNPTAEHKEQAEEHRRVSAAHRAASQALRDAEDRACHGISEANRDVSPFFHGEAIVSVEPAEEKVTYGKQFVTRTKGAVVVFRAAPGLTAEWFQREIDCHLARAAAVGHEMPEMAYCPLVLKGVKATVSSRGGGFAVQVLADDQQTSDEILRRARTAKR